MTMNILVTGGAGYIGSFVVHKLIEMGHFVVVYDNLSTGAKEALHPKCKFVLGDIRDRELPARVMKDNKIDIIFHFAAKLIVPESVEKPLDYYENNFFGTLNIIQCAERSKVNKMIFSSTAAVYGEPVVNSADISLIDESSAVDPINPYGQSKAFSEKLLFDFHKTTGFNFISLRYFNIAGANVEKNLGPRNNKANHLIKVLCDLALGKRTEVSIFGNDYPTFDGTGVRDYIHVEDLAEAHIHAMNYLIEKNNKNELVADVFNCGYGVGYSVKQVIKAVEKITQKKLNIVIAPRRRGDPAQMVADNKKLIKNFNWVPQYNDLEKICLSAFEWEKRN